MKKILSRSFSFTTMCIFIALSVIACSKNEPAKLSDRPANVPASAFKVQGPGEEAFVLIMKPEDFAQHVYAGIVYHGNGDPWFSGKMGLTPRSAGFPDMNNKESYLKWDGETIFLSDERTLKSLHKE